MKLALVLAAVLLLCAVLPQAKPQAQNSAQAPAAAPQEPATWMVIGMNNLQKDPDENYGHGEGDSLTVIIHGEAAVGGLSELEGSQQDPSPICMTGTYRNGILHMQSHPEDVPYQSDEITIRGELYPIPHGHAFHGRIVGGPYHSDPNSTNPPFPSVVTLRALHDEHDSEEAADSLANDSCACQWKKHITAKNFVTAKCPATPSE